MRSDVQFVALPIENFSYLFLMNDAQLESHERGACVQIRDIGAGVSMDALVSERGILTLSASTMIYRKSDTDVFC